jgi:hypothetical protein
LLPLARLPPANAAVAAKAISRAATTTTEMIRLIVFYLLSSLTLLMTANNEAVKGLGCLYSPTFLEGVFSETQLRILDFFSENSEAI